MSLTSISPDFRESLRELADAIAKKQEEKNIPKMPQVEIKVCMKKEDIEEIESESDNCMYSNQVREI